MTLFTIRPDNPEVFSRACELLANMNTSKTFTVEITIGEKPRTLQQNRYFHDIRDLIADFTGDDKESIKRRLVHSTLGAETYRDKDGYIRETLGSTSELDTKEFSRLIEAAQEVCVLLGINYPLPSYYGLR